MVKYVYRVSIELSSKMHPYVYVTTLNDIDSIINEIQNKHDLDSGKPDLIKIEIEKIVLYD